MTYVVCQTGNCQQTYPLSYFGNVTKETKNVYCEKCGGILVDKDGRANFSQNANVIPVIKSDELEADLKLELKEAKDKKAEIQKEIKRLEKELTEC